MLVLSRYTNIAILNNLTDKRKQFPVPKCEFPSAIFNTDELYFKFLDNILAQANFLSISPHGSFYIAANQMMSKKVFADFMCETKRRLLEYKQEAIDSKKEIKELKAIIARAGIKAQSSSDNS